MSKDTVKDTIALMLCVRGDNAIEGANQCTIESRGKMTTINRNAIYKIARAVENITDVTITATKQGSNRGAMKATAIAEASDYIVKRGKSASKHARSKTRKSGRKDATKFKITDRGVRDSGPDVLSLVTYVINEVFDLSDKVPRQSSQPVSEEHAEAIAEVQAAEAALKAAREAAKAAKKKGRKK